MSRVQGILQHFTQDLGLFQQLFGDNERILLNQQKMKAKHQLKTIFGYEDVDYLWPDEIDEPKVERILSMLFKFQYFGENQQEKLSDELLNN